MLTNLLMVMCKMLGNTCFLSKSKGNQTFLFAVSIYSIELLVLTLPLITFVNLEKPLNVLIRSGNQVIPTLHVSNIDCWDQMKSDISVSQSVVLGSTGGP